MAKLSEFGPPTITLVQPDNLFSTEIVNILLWFLATNSVVLINQITIKNS